MKVKTVGLCFLALPIAWFVGSTMRLAINTVPGGEQMDGLIFESCPKCAHRIALSPGKETRCKSCGERLAACERCGRLLEGPEVTGQEPDGVWLCKAHRDVTRWEDDRLREFATQEALTLPADTPRAAGSRQHFEDQIREVYSRKKAPSEELFLREKRSQIKPGNRDEVHPKNVIEAYLFYERAVEDRDNGSVALFRWNFNGKDLHLVRCSTDGSNGFLEIYDADGTPLGFARTDWDCPVWSSKGIVRRRTFVGDQDEVDAELPKARRRLGSSM